MKITIGAGQIPSGLMEFIKALLKAKRASARCRPIKVRNRTGEPKHFTVRDGSTPTAPTVHLHRRRWSGKFPYPDDV
jgi:hypothetical protein